MPAPRVSIVIVNWKTPKLLAECLNSVALDPKSDGFEIHVVDNNSGDESVAMLVRDFPHVKVLANDFNAGFSKGCNQVIPLCTAPYILLLNPDTKVEDCAISKLADFIDTNSGCGAVGPKVLNFDGSLQLACRRAFPDPAAAFFRVTYLSRLFPNNQTFARYNYSFADPDEQMEVDALSGSCMMVRRDVVEKIGLLDEDIFMFGEDIDWCWRIKQAKWTVNYYPKAVVYHIHGAASRFRPIGTTIDLHKGMHVFYKKHLAQKYWAPFNLLVYAAIWSRAAIFVLVNWLRAAAARSAAKEMAVASPSDKLEIRSGNLK
ncbi:MAG TPA: glycosyltransferase family 2 protein [Oculatellaceae cyanobacterium]